MPVARWAAVAITVLACWPAGAEDVPQRAVFLPNGSGFSAWGPFTPGSRPLVLNNAFAEDSAEFRALIDAGFLVVKVGLSPCGEFDCWLRALASGADPIAEYVAAAEAMLDYLEREGLHDKARVVAVGASFSAFMLLHVAAANPRIKAVAALAPVTRMWALREAAAHQGNPFLDAADLVLQAGHLARIAILIAVSNDDQRIGAKLPAELARAIVKAAPEGAADVTLLVTGAGGHGVPPMAERWTVEWLVEKTRR